MGKKLFMQWSEVGGNSGYDQKFIIGTATREKVHNEKKTMVCFLLELQCRGPGTLATSV